jgi:hypothetical protein
MITSFRGELTFFYVQGIMPTLLIVRVGLGHGSDSHLADPDATKMSSLQFSSIFPRTTATGVSHFEGTEVEDVSSANHSLPVANDVEKRAPEEYT